MTPTTSRPGTTRRPPSLGRAPRACRPPAMTSAGGLTNTSPARWTAREPRAPTGSRSQGNVSQPVAEPWSRPSPPAGSRRPPVPGRCRRRGWQAGGERPAIGFRVSDDGLDAERPARADDPHRDLAAVGDEDPGQGHPAGSMRNRGWPYSTSSPLDAQTSATVPATPASIEFIIFMTSIRQTTVPAVTALPTST